MKRALLLAAWLAVPAVALADDYSGMLAYLDVTRIDGRALAGASGAIAINQAAGDLNIQANLHGMASGDRADVAIAARQQHSNDVVLSAPLEASAHIAGQALAGASGIASINQASGIANTTLNVVSATLARQGIRESDDTALAASDIASAGGRAIPVTVLRRVSAVSAFPRRHCGASTVSCNSIRSRERETIRPMFWAWSCRATREYHPPEPIT